MSKSNKLRGDQTLSGSWGEVWIDGEIIMELKKIEVKISANREDVQFGFDVDSKITSLKGEITIGVTKVYSRWLPIFEKWKNGEDPRMRVITKLADPGAVDKQQERYSIDNVWFNELPLVNYEKGGIIEDEVSGGFTPTDMVNLDKIA